MKFILEIIENNGTETIIPIHPDDYQLIKFSEFQLTKEALSNKVQFERFIEQQIGAGKLHCKSFKIHDLQIWREKKHDFYSSNVVKARHYSAFDYYVRGRLLTKRRDAALRQENEEIKITTS